MAAANAVQGGQHAPAKAGHQPLRLFQPIAQGKVDEGAGAAGLVVFIHGAEAGRRVVAVVAQHGEAYLLLYRRDVHVEQGGIEGHGAIQIPSRNVGPDQGIVHLRILPRFPADATGDSLRVGVAEQGRHQ